MHMQLHMYVSMLVSRNLSPSPFPYK